MKKTIVFTLLLIFFITNLSTKNKEINIVNQYDKEILEIENNLYISNRNLDNIDNNIDK